MIDGQGRKVAHANGVAIGFGAGNDFRANVATRTGFVVDDDGLTQDGTHGLGNLTRSRVCVAACCVGANPCDGFAGVLVLRLNQAG